MYLVRKTSTIKKVNDLADLENHDPKQFWASIKKILSPDKDCQECVELSGWFEHFKDLLNCPLPNNTDKQFIRYVADSLELLETIAENNVLLNKPITSGELKEVICHIKTGKSSYLDEIPNEALKFGSDELSKPLLHLYNTVNNLHAFPNSWNEGLIIPIHKRGDKCNTDNYRGIVISSCVGKIYLKVLTMRIENHMASSGLWKFNQCGFKKDHRTEDNLFVLNTVYESHVVNKNEKVYVAIVDFTKYFDLINRNFLLYKLLKYGITGPIYYVIKSMYSDTKYRVRIHDKISPSLMATSGVKQGCTMSPILSNLYQNDLHDIFNDACDPVQLGEVSISSVSWADDLLLLSTSVNGLQRCLDLLHAYCYKWGLHVNTLKTKAMVLTKQRYKTERFMYNGTLLECVKSFNYLGFEISHNGKFSNLINDRVLKAEKTSNMVLQAIRTDKNVSVKLSLSLFDKQIYPILSYGCSVWSLPDTHNLIYLDAQNENQNARNIVSNILFNLLGRNVPIKYARKIGRRNHGHNRSILIRLSSYDDVMETMRASQGSCYCFRKFQEKNPSDLEKVHTNYMKRSLNINKHASNVCVYEELDRFPITHRACSMAIKYWLRLTTGTQNRLVNEAYKTAIHEKHNWVQCIQALLNTQGFGDVWFNPFIASSSFHKLFKTRLDDQFKQERKGKLLSSSRFDTLKYFIEDDRQESYIYKIRNPCIRKIFTRLRIDMNVL